MRFKTELLEAIRDGRKTVTRRLVKTEECPYKVGRVYSATNRMRFEASGTNANATGGWFSLPIKIVSVRRERLSDITEEEAVREGFRADSSIPPHYAFLVLWGAIHKWDGGEHASNPEVWRIKFQRVPESWK